MKIEVTNEIREKLEREGLGYVCFDGFVEVDSDAYDHFAPLIDRDYQHVSKSERQALIVLCCLTHPDHRKQVATVVGVPEQSVPVVPTVDLSVIVRLLGYIRWELLILILLVLFCAMRANAQRGTSSIDVITFEHNDGSVTAVYAAPFRLIEGTNITFAKGSCPGTTCGKLIIAGSSTAATAWSAITPTNNAQAGTFSASGNSWDFTSASIFKLRSKAGLTTTANGDLGYDTTAGIWHLWQGSDRYLIAATNLGGTNQVCVWAANGTCTFAQLSYLQVSGLGGAAQLNVGTTNGTVAAGDDSRIVNALAASTVNSAYIIGKFNSGTCSGYLKSDGTCDVPSVGAASSLSSAYIDWNASSGGSSILNKPSLGTAATKNFPATGDAAATEVVLGADTRMTNARTPTAHNHVKADITDFPSLGTLAAKNAVDYSTAEVLNKPTLGTAAALNVGTASNTVAAGDDSRINGALQSTALNSTLVISKFGGGACSGYLKSDGTCDVPTTGAASSLTGAYIDWNAVSGGSSILNKPTLGSLAAKNSVDYSTTDITNKPTLGTAAALNIPATGNAAVGEVVKGSDTRLSDARTPTTHSHAESEVTNLGTDLAAKEAVANKSTTTTLGTSDTLYPTQNAVKSYVDTGLATKAASNASTTVNSQTCALGGSCTITATATPAGSSTEIQYKNGAALGAIAGTAWDGSTLTLPPVQGGSTTDQSLELPNATSPAVSSASSVKIDSQSNKLMVSENTAAYVEVAKVTSNITGTSAGITGKTTQGNGTLLPLATGTATAGKQLAYDASGNIIASSYDVGAAGTYNLPAAQANTLGGVKGTGASLTCSGTNKVTGFDANGAMQCGTDQTGGTGSFTGLTDDGDKITVTEPMVHGGTPDVALVRTGANTLSLRTVDANGNIASTDDGVLKVGSCTGCGGGATPAGNSGDLQTNNGSGGLGSVPQSTFATSSDMTTALAAKAPNADPNFTGTVDIDTGLNIGGATILTGNPVGIAGTTNGYIQVNIQNKSNGTTASSDYVATADTGNDTTNYIDLGINSSGYTNAAYNIGGALSGYLYTNGGDLTIGTQSAAKVLKFHTGGTTSDKLRVTINDTALIASGINDGLASITLTNSTPVAMGGTYNTGYYYNQHGTAATAVTYTLPATAAGKQYCVKNSIVGGTGAADTGVITVNPAASSYLIKDGTIGTVSNGISSGGAAGDGACFVAIDATHWEVYVQKGAWTLIP